MNGGRDFLPRSGLVGARRHRAGAGAANTGAVASGNPRRCARADQNETPDAHLQNMRGLQRVALLGEARQRAFDGLDVAHGAQLVADGGALGGQARALARSSGAAHRLGIKMHDAVGGRVMHAGAEIPRLASRLRAADEFIAEGQRACAIEILAMHGGDQRAVAICPHAGGQVHIHDRRGAH